MLERSIVLASAACFLFLFNGTALAQETCFDFTGGENSPHFVDLNEVESGSTILGSVSLTMTAISSTGIPELDFDNTDGIGVNITGNVNDENDKLDAAVAQESIEFQFLSGVEFDDILIDGMGWSSVTDYEFCDVFVNDQYVATLLDTDADASTTALHSNPILGAASDTFEGLGIVLEAGDILRISYGETGINNGWRVEKIGVTPAVPTEVSLSPDSIEVTRGNVASGGATELEFSDNLDLSLFRSNSDIQAITEFEAKTVSPFATPSAISVTLEGAVFGRSAVNQTLEAFDYTTQSWVLIDMRPASRFSDSSLTVPLSGGDFVEPGTQCMSLRVRFRSVNPRQSFSSNTDFLEWTLIE